MFLATVRVRRQAVRMTTDRIFDAAVVGGGFAGLAAALTLARARRQVVVIDAGDPRNSPAAHSHGFLTRDGVPPLEILKIGRGEVSGYGAEIVRGTVSSLKRLSNTDLTIGLDDGGQVLARRVLLSTGLVDEIPDIPGLSDRWGRDVVHCPFCFGWELRDARLGVLATTALAPAQALMWRQWSPYITVLQHTSSPADRELAEKLAARGIDVIEGRVVGIEVLDDRLRGVRLDGGRFVELDAVVVGQWMQARNALLDMLDVPMVDHPAGIGSAARADAAGMVAPGVWVAGNAADVTLGVLQSAASGVSVAAAINVDLTAEDTTRAVQRYQQLNYGGGHND
jgi:thioredoxin reductase